FGTLLPCIRDLHPMGVHVKELYLPFKAHTSHIAYGWGLGQNKIYCIFRKINPQLKSLFADHRHKPYARNVVSNLKIRI
ncbi:hypothetical protein, partial [Psychroflexus sediminis]|uniref:hypothetical protein n=1 Tax=Psychroflexus sediminis TaxID=470826 RepID=UPI001C408F7F